jgi:hypothetical protein
MWFVCVGGLITNFICKKAVRLFVGLGRR